MAIPKMLYVSEQTPHGPHTLDIYSRLLDDQIILLTGKINEDTAESIIAQLLYLEAKDFEGDVHLYIDSPGGLVTAGLAVYDAMQCTKFSIETICIGQAASMAAVLLAAGAKGKRWMARIKEHLNEILVHHTGQPMEVIEKDTDRDFFLSSEEAVEYGLIDKIMRAGEGVVTANKRI